MKKILIALAGFCMLAITSCKKAENAQAYAGVMFFNGCYGTPTLFPTVNGSRLSTSVGPYLNTEYLSLKTGAGQQIALVRYDGSVLATSQATFTGNNYFSIFASGASDAPSMVITQDNLLKPSSGMAKVRFIDLCSESLSLECSYNGVEFPALLSYQMVTPFIEVAPGKAAIVVGDKNDVKRRATANPEFADAGIYTIVFSGKSPDYKLSVITNY